jgi:uncharacterized membrane protein YjjB (DUF3815 family)
MRVTHWIIFGASQCVGMILIALDHGPCAGVFAIPGMIMLLPGVLIAFALPHALDQLPQWAGYLVGGLTVVSVNALTWYFVAKLGEPKPKCAS